MIFLSALLFFSLQSVWTKEIPKTSFSYKLYQTFPTDLKGSNSGWTTEVRFEEVFLMPNGDLLLEIKKESYYIVYFKQKKSFFFIDQKKKRKRQLSLNSPPRGMSFKLTKSQVENCGKNYTLSSLSRMGEVIIEACLATMNSKILSPLLELFINTKIRKTIDLKSEHFLMFLSTSTVDGNLIYKREFYKRTTGKKLPTDMYEFLKYDLIEPACEEIYCGNLMNLRPET